MTKIRREEVIDEALDLLNEVGLDGVTTRRLAQRLGVESATLYWHFKSKGELLSEMASCVLARHHLHEVPQTPTHWRNWLADNGRSFRRALLAYRDGARLHAGTRPNAMELERITKKLDYLVRAGIPEPEAAMALYSLGQFTIGCVLEEQVHPTRALDEPKRPLQEVELSSPALYVAGTVDTSSGKTAFEFGMRLLLDGLESQISRMQNLES